MPIATAFLTNNLIRADMLTRDVVTEAAVISVGPREFQDGTTKLVVQLENGQGLVLNQTRLRQMIAAFGENYDGWIGQKIRYWRGSAPFQGKPAAAVIIEPIIVDRVTAAPAP
jgi:hypothetical protein